MCQKKQTVDDMIPSSEVSQGTMQCQTQYLIFLRRCKRYFIKSSFLALVFLVVCEPNAYSPNLVI